MRHKARDATFSIIVLASAAVIRAQPGVSLENRFATVLTHMGSEDRSVRNQGLDELLALIGEEKGVGFDPD